MSGKFTLILIVAAVGAAAWYGNERLKAGKPLKVSKADILHAVKSTARHTAKVTGPLRVNVELDGAAPVQVGDVYKLVGFVSATESVEEVNLSWIVPPAAEVISGQLRQAAVRMEPDQEIRLELTLRAKTNGPQKVNLKATGRQNETRFGATSHYTNKPAANDFKNDTDQLNTQQAPESPREQKVFR